MNADTMPKGIVSAFMYSVKEMSTKNSIASKNFENLEINDVLEIIEVLLNYIRKKKSRKPRSHPSYPCERDARAPGG